jgi:1-acyl-sn-glycerol-3-phosphate acyltransferase
MLDPVYVLAAGFYKPVLKLVWRIRPSGMEHLPKGGFVIASNHVSNVDPFAVAWAVWPREIRFMAKAELFTRWFAWAMRGAGTFPVKREQADPEALKTAVRLLRSGEIVGMFPEGTRQRKGLNKKFEARAHSGTARIALTAHVPLIPVGIVGTERLLSFDQVRVAYGPPIPVDDLADLPRKKAAEIATERLMTAIYDLVAELRGEAPASASAA